MSAHATTARLPFRRMTITRARAEGLTPVRMPVEALHKWLPADGTVTPVWERIGAVHAEVEYGLFHMRAVEGAVEQVRADGSVVVRYPLGAGRTVRTVTRRA